MAHSTLVLVHGAWHGSWCWRELGTVLDERGTPWLAVDLPSSQREADPRSTLAQDAAVVAEACEVDGTVTLVGHSYGGAVIAEAAHLITNLEGLIYVAALVPLVGQSATDASREVRARTKLDEAITVHGEFLALDPAMAVAALYADCAPRIQDWAVEQLSTQSISSFRSPRRGPDAPVPSRYIKCTDDHGLAPELQDVMAERTDRVLTLASGHCPFLSRPSDLADLLDA